MHLSVRHLKAKKNPAVFILKKNPNHKQVLVYLKVHQVHTKKNETNEGVKLAQRASIPRKRYR